MAALFQILIFPGVFFLGLFGLIGEFIDRKLYARLQNRIGPPWYQTFADFLKLLAKEDLVPAQASPVMFKTMPLLALAASIAPFFYIPLWKVQALFSFSGDIIVVLYLLTIPTLAFFIGGWYSASLYARIGSMRTLTQLFAYEVPLFMGLLAPALLADSWSISEISLFYSQHPWYWVFNFIGFSVSLVALLGKLEKVPFDIPEAETEIVAGCFTEYSGRLFAFFKLAIDVEMIVGASLLAAIFLPFGFGLAAPIGFVVYILKVLFIISLLVLLRTIFARMRIDQMTRFCWRYLAPVALVQLLIDLILKGVLK